MLATGAMSLILATVEFSAPYYERDSLNCRLEDLSRLERIAAARLYSGPDSGSATLLRQHPILPGWADSFVVEPGTYWVAMVDSAGNESCWGDSVVVPPVVGVFPPRQTAAARPEYYDLAGRRVPNPRRPGVYWVKKNGKKKLVILR